MALFTDDPAVRGAKPLMDSTGAIGKGYEAWIAFIYQREDARLLSTSESADPHLAQSLRMAYDLGLKVFAFH